MPDGFCMVLPSNAKPFLTTDRDCTRFDYRKTCVYKDIGKWDW